ncbi:MAG: hypothetical protein F6J87_01220 [Spirulina sp. SIO3F2]|nr:hypothetical protein [Spirulina sp. SIO3F2]
MITIPDSQQYTYNVGWSQTHQAFQGVCAEFPELYCLAASAEAALAAIQQEAATTLQARIRANEILPLPLPRPAALPLRSAPPARTWRNRLIVALLLMLSFVLGLTASFWLDTNPKHQPEPDTSPTQYSD